MAIGTRDYAGRYSGSGGLPPAIKWLLIANVALFLLIFFGGQALASVVRLLILTPAQVLTRGFIWQLATHFFIHVDVLGTVWLLLALWMFGSQFEQMWGTRKFLQFYFLCGVGSGVLIVLTQYLFGSPLSPMMTCSAAIYGLLLVTAMMNPEGTAMFSFVIPMKMKHLVMLIVAIGFLFAFRSGNTTGELAQLFGGLLMAYIFMKSSSRTGFAPMAALKQGYREWKIQRAKRKFQVYLKKQNSERDRRVH